MIEFLLGPIDPARPHEVGAFISWHGRLMVLAWSFLFPIGILVARFMKVTPGQDWPRVVDNKAWWHTHLSTQYCGGVAVVLALWLVYQVTGFRSTVELHRYFGWITVGLCALQFVAGWLRGTKGGPDSPAPDGSLAGDHYDMTLRRNIFEYCHKSMGYLALLMAAAATLTGLWEANGPVWMWIGLGVWWLAMIVAFVVLQSRGLTIDTYQAIWGPDPIHPGNRIKPIGLGISRPDRERAAESRTSNSRG